MTPRCLTPENTARYPPPFVTGLTLLESSLLILGCITEPAAVSADQFELCVVLSQRGVRTRLRATTAIRIPLSFQRPAGDCRPAAIGSLYLGCCRDPGGLDDGFTVQRLRVIACHHSDSLLVIVRIALGEHLDRWCEIPSHCDMGEVDHCSGSHRRMTGDDCVHPQNGRSTAGRSVGSQHVAIVAILRSAEPHEVLGTDHECHSGRVEVIPERLTLSCQNRVESELSVHCQRVSVRPREHAGGDLHPVAGIAKELPIQYRCNVSDETILQR